MGIASRQVLACRLAVMVVRGKHPGEPGYGGRGSVPPVLAHSSATSLGLPLAQLASVASKAVPKQSFGDMVQQGSESQSFIPLCCFTRTFKPP